MTYQVNFYEIDPGNGNTEMIARFSPWTDENPVKLPELEERKAKGEIERYGLMVNLDCYFRKIS